MSNTSAGWMDSVFPYDGGPVDMESPRVAEERARQERIAHTYRLKCGDVSFECYLPYSSPQDGKMWVKLEASQLPDELLPPEISREQLEKTLYKIGYKGYIEANFIQVEDGSFVASDVWMNRFEYACEKVRKSIKL